MREGLIAKPTTIYYVWPDGDFMEASEYSFETSSKSDDYSVAYIDDDIEPDDLWLSIRNHLEDQWRGPKARPITNISKEK